MTLVNIHTAKKNCIYRAMSHRVTFRVSGDPDSTVLRLQPVGVSGEDVFPLSLKGARGPTDESRGHRETTGGAEEVGGGSEEEIR